MVSAEYSTPKCPPPQSAREKIQPSFQTNRVSSISISPPPVAVIVKWGILCHMNASKTQLERSSVRCSSSFSLVLPCYHLISSSKRVSGNTDRCSKRSFCLNLSSDAAQKVPFSRSRQQSIVHRGRSSRYLSGYEPEHSMLQSARAAEAKKMLKDLWCYKPVFLVSSPKQSLGADILTF